MIWSGEAIVGALALMGSFIGYLIYMANRAGRMTAAQEQMARNIRLLSRRVGSLVRHVHEQNGRIGKNEVRIERLEEDIENKG